MQLAKLETAVKTMHSVANDQAAKYRGEMKKVPFEIFNLLQFTKKEGTKNGPLHSIGPTPLAKVDESGWVR